ncbi:COG1361 S-layer family protein [Halorubrum sp. AJ67]|uniref:COG1361 S-layer family protein n=1 Tax=Halorubrum sp. AJ67 TaxID=1173487 RepID=UPI001E53ED1C|nr:exo-alpha-sialidase [Halorubrum sp. AJ67]
MYTRPLSVILVSVLLVTSGIGIGAVSAEMAGLGTGVDATNGEMANNDAAAAIDGPTDGASAQTESNARGSPDMGAYVTNPNIVPGQTNEVGVTITNDGNLRSGTPQEGEAVTTARNVRIKAEAEGPISVESDTIAIGSVTTTTPSEAPVSINVPENIDAGSYSIDLDITYTYLSSSGNNDRTVTVSRSVDVRVRNDARFQVVDAESNAQVGDSGTLDVELENTGLEPATRADVQLTSAAGALTFSGGQSSTARIAELAPGETATVTYDVEVAADSAVRSYAVTGEVIFKDPSGITRTDESLSFGVRPLAEQDFTVDDVQPNLYVGEDGEVRGSVTNEGPEPARNVVVRYTGEDQNVLPIERSTAVGTLDPGESTSFTLPIAINGEAEPGLRSLDLAVGYRNADGEVRTDDDLVVDVAVEPKRDRFGVEVQNRTISAGGTRMVDVAVTNNMNETASDIEGRLFANDPLDTGDTDTGYVQSLDPGETTTMTLEVTTTGSATPGSTYPISLDFRYDDADGDSQLTDTYRVPIDVTESEDGGLPLPVIVVALLVVGTGVLVVYRRRQ